MSRNEARQIVQDGLEQRKIERERRDAQLEQQERILRLKINDNHTWKTLSEAQQEKIRKEAEAKCKKLRAEKKAQALARELEVDDTVQKSILAGLSILLAAGIFRLNVFVALALVLGLAVFPAVKIYRLYFPLEEVSK